MDKSVAVVVLDAVRSDFFEQEFDWIPGQHYEQVYSTSHWTIPAHASLFTGLMPRETGTYAGSPSFSPPQDHLAKQLQDVGYMTRMYTANIQLTQWEGWTDGFNEIVGPEVKNKNNNICNWIDVSNDTLLSGSFKYPEVVIRCLLSNSTIASIREGFKLFMGDRKNAPIKTEDVCYKFKNKSLTDKEFVFFNLMDVHSSIGRSTGKSIAEGVPDSDELSELYHDSINNLSKDYQELFNHLYEEFDWVITLSDHGELLGEYGLSGHGYGIYPELVEIPLVISSQTGSCSYPTEDLVSLVDITSTIRDICDIDDYGRGQSLLDVSTKQKALVERLGQPHLHENMFKRLNIYDEFEKYNIPLRGLAINKKDYIFETMSKVESTEKQVKNRKKILNTHFNEINTLKSEKSGSNVSSAVEERLKDLGYA